MFADDLRTMNLPNLYLADLPGEAIVTPSLVREACSAIKRNRASWLARRTTGELVDLIAYVGERWMDSGNPFRRAAVTHGAAELGLSREVVAAGLDTFFGQLTAEKLNALLIQDLGDTRRLDEFTGGIHELRLGRSAMAHGPELLAQVATGTLPNSTLWVMMAGLLLKSAQFVKCARNASLIPRLFAHSIAELEPKIGACFELARWRGGTVELESALWTETDCVVAQGDDETIESLRCQMPATTRFVAYGHKVSFGFVGSEVLSGYGVQKVAERAALDVAMWDQHGCLSPHLFYVEGDGVVPPEGFADHLAKALAALEVTFPRARLSDSDAGQVAQARLLHELRASHFRATHAEAYAGPRGAFFEPPTGGTEVWSSEQSTAWTVVFEADSRFRTSILNRFIYVKPCRNLEDALRYAEPFRQKTSTVGLAVAESRAGTLAAELARWGVPRICPLGRMQNPPMGWRHDGRPALAELVRWSDWEV
jgi:hypothetical protein